MLLSVLLQAAAAGVGVSKLGAAACNNTDSNITFSF